MALEVFANNAAAVVMSGGTDAPAPGTQEVWTLAGSTLPIVSSAGPLDTQCYVCDTVANTEKILVINISGSTATVIRGADTTTPVTHIAGFTIQQVLTHGSIVGLQTQWANIQDPQYAGGADPTASVDSTAAIQAALLSFGTLSSWSQGTGGVVYVPQGQYIISKTLIIPSGVTLAGSGWGSQITLVTNSQCDMIQTATYNSSSQATILGVSASAITNAFWVKIRDIALHGDSFHATIPAYFHGINVTTNPALSTGPGDPDFDPQPTIENVWVKAVTGDGYYHSGRSGAFLKRVWVEDANGNGFTLSFDTTLVDCLAEGCSTGFYFNHASDVGAGCKSYNNFDYTWTSGFSYTPGWTAVYNGVYYWCTTSVSGSTPPPSDTVHWTELANATSPWATGYGYYWDTNCGEHSWSAVDGQQNSRGDYFFGGPNAGGISLDGTSAYVNYNNGQPSYSAVNASDFAAITFDGVSGVNARLSSSKQAGGSGIVCATYGTVAGVNTLIATTDGTEHALFYGGVPTFALVNGTVQSVLAGLQAVTSGVSTLPYAATINTVASAGNHFRFTLTGNAAMTASNLTDGQKITYEVIQDSAGSRLLSWGTVYDFGTVGSPTLSTTPSKRDVLGFIYSASAGKLLFGGAELGF